MMVSFAKYVVLEDFSGISYGTEYLNLHRGQTIYVVRESTVEGWAWGKFEEDNGELIQGWFPQAFAEPREDGATVGDLKEKESQEISGVDVPACDVFQQPPPPPPSPPVTQDYWILLYKRCLDAGLIKGGKENSDVGGSEWWHCPYCMKDIRVENLDAHLTKASHIKWYENAFTLDDLNNKKTR